MRAAVVLACRAVVLWGSCATAGATVVSVPSAAVVGPKGGPRRHQLTRRAFQRPLRPFRRHGASFWHRRGLRLPARPCDDASAPKPAPGKTPDDPASPPRPLLSHRPVTASDGTFRTRIAPPSRCRSSMGRCTSQSSCSSRTERRWALRCIDDLLRGVRLQQRRPRYPSGCTAGPGSCWQRQMV